LGPRQVVVQFGTSARTASAQLSASMFKRHEPCNSINKWRVWHQHQGDCAQPLCYHLCTNTFLKGASCMAFAYGVRAVWCLHDACCSLLTRKWIFLSQVWRLPVCLAALLVLTLVVWHLKIKQCCGEAAAARPHQGQCLPFQECRFANWVEQWWNSETCRASHPLVKCCRSVHVCVST
jgi:hypothetical protein